MHTLNRTINRISRDPQAWLIEQLWWLKWPFLLAVLLLAAGLGYTLKERSAMMLLIVLVGLPVGLIGAYLLLRWMALGFVLLMPANMIVPFAVGTGSQTSINASLLMIMGMFGLWLFDMINNQRRIWLHKSRPILPLLLLIFSSFISFLAGQLNWFTVAGAPVTAQFGGFAIILISACAFLLAAHHLHDTRWLQWIVWTFIIVGASFIILRLMPPQVFRRVGRLYQHGSYSSQFWLWFIVLTFTQAWLNNHLHKGWRLVLLGLSACAFYAVFVLEFDWKSGWVPPLIGLTAVVALYSRRMATLMVTVGIFALPLGLSYLIATDEYSYGTRVDAWIILGEIIKVSPILGLGPANYYWYTPLYAIRGYAVEFNSHNQYIDLLAQIGFLGTGFVLWFFVEVGIVGWRLLKVVPEGFPRAYMYGALGGFVAMVVSGMLGDWFLPFVYNIGIVGMRSSLLGWVFMGSFVALEYVYLTNPQPTINPDQPATAVTGQLAGR